MLRGLQQPAPTHSRAVDSLCLSQALLGGAPSARPADAGGGVAVWRDGPARTGGRFCFCGPLEVDPHRPALGRGW